MNKSASNKIATPIILGTILSVLLLALSETSNASPPIAINRCTDITTSGSYKLIADLTSEAVCITIRASNVDLRLDGLAQINEPPILVALLSLHQRGMVIARYYGSSSYASEEKYFSRSEPL